MLYSVGGDGCLNQGDGRFQILSLDGGGAKGVFAAAILAFLEEDLNDSVVNHFDLIVGTSTGGLIALALGAGLTPRQIVSFYHQEARNVFPGPQWWRGVRRVLVAKYNGKGLESAVRRILGDVTLGESSIPLVIPAYNLAENNVYIFKTPHHETLKRDWKVPMWEVAMATSAAPTYFPAYKLRRAGVRLIDGGVWASNPAMVGVTEAVSLFGRRLEDIRVLSLGTTSSARARSRQLDNAGLIRWARGPHIVDVLLAGQGAGAFAQAQHLVGDENALRIDPPILDGDASMDGDNTETMLAKAAHHSRSFCPRFEKTFGDHHRQPYDPLYASESKAVLT